MARKAKQETSDERPEPVLMVAVDAGSGLYRDRSGAPRGVQISEGKDNFAAITDGARAAVAEAKAREDSDGV